MVPINRTGSGGVRLLGHSHQRIVEGGALLKNGGILEDPRIGTYLPFRVGVNHPFCCRIIEVIVGPKIEVGCSRNPWAEAGEKLGLHQAIFVMSPFRPRIRK
jgi:hypothetical protein